MPAIPRRIIVTRPEAQGLPWCEQLMSAGYRVASLPVLDIVPVSDDTHRQAVKTHILALDECAYIIFVSQNAVSLGFDWIDDYWPQFPEALQCLAVGAKTEQALCARLQAFGLNAQSRIASGSKMDREAQMSREAQMDSEALLALPCLADVEDKKILIFRGLGGRTKLFEELSARGAKVNHCELYERKLPSAAAENMTRLKLDAEEDIVTLFSGESLQNFYTLLQREQPSAWQRFSLLVPSARVSQQAKSLGFENITRAVNASEEAMSQALASVFPRS